MSIIEALALGIGIPLAAAVIFIALRRPSQKVHKTTPVNTEVKPRMGVPQPTIVDHETGALERALKADYKTLDERTDAIDEAVTRINRKPRGRIDRSNLP